MAAVIPRVVGSCSWLLSLGMQVRPPLFCLLLSISPFTPYPGLVPFVWLSEPQSLPDFSGDRLQAGVRATAMLLPLSCYCQTRVLAVVLVFPIHHLVLGQHSRLWHGPTAIEPHEMVPLMHGPTAVEPRGVVPFMHGPTAVEPHCMVPLMHGPTAMEPHCMVPLMC